MAYIRSNEEFDEKVASDAKAGFPLIHNPSFADPARTAFEAHAKAIGFSVLDRRKLDGSPQEYLNGFLEARWQGWRACWKHRSNP